MKNPRHNVILSEMERWSNEESETQCYTVRTEQENMLGYLNYFSRFKPSTPIFQYSVTDY
jgi:hypothetical protein